jgi:hypothetical protein
MKEGGLVDHFSEERKVFWVCWTDLDIFHVS